MEASSSSISENLTLSRKIAPNQAKICYQVSFANCARRCLNLSIPCAVLGHRVRISQLQMPQGVLQQRRRGLSLVHSLQRQKVWALLKLWTVRLKGEYSCPSCPILRKAVSISTSAYSGVVPGGKKAVESRLSTSLPLDLPIRTVGAGKSQLVRNTNSPVLIFSPSQVPPDFMSLPPQMFASSAKAPNQRVDLSVCSSRLNPRMNLMREAFSGSLQKKVRHILQQ